MSAVGAGAAGIAVDAVTVSGRTIPFAKCGMPSADGTKQTSA